MTVNFNYSLVFLIMLIKLFVCKDQLKNLGQVRKRNKIRLAVFPFHSHVFSFIHHKGGC